MYVYTLHMYMCIYRPIYTYIYIHELDVYMECPNKPNVDDLLETERT